MPVHVHCTVEVHAIRSKQLSAVLLPPNFEILCMPHNPVSIVTHDMCEDRNIHVITRAL